MPIVISRMQSSDIGGAVECVQRAFKDDPYSLWVFDQSQFNAARNTASLSTRCRWGIKYGVFFVAKDPTSSTPDRVLGTAMWLPPSIATPAPPRTWSEWFVLQNANWSLWCSQVLTNAYYMGRGGLNVDRYWAWKTAQSEAQTALWDDERGYYFCNIITVLPEDQGKGIGRSLCAHVTSIADAEGRACYLESSRLEPNVQIYEKMGFRLCREMPCREGPDDPGITLYCMKRAPNAVTSSAAV